MVPLKRADEGRVVSHLCRIGTITFVKAPDDRGGGTPKFGRNKGGKRAEFPNWPKSLPPRREDVRRKGCRTGKPKLIGAALGRENEPTGIGHCESKWVKCSKNRPQQGCKRASSYKGRSKSADDWKRQVSSAWQSSRQWKGHSWANGVMQRQPRVICKRCFQEQEGDGGNEGVARIGGGESHGIF